MYRQCIILAIAASAYLSPTAQAEDERFSIQPFFGYNQMSDPSAISAGVGVADGATQIETDAGFAAGIAVGYQIDQRWSAELAWDYRSVETSTQVADGTLFSEGNFASNLFYLNGRYTLSPNNEWLPYVGAGLVVGQEIDIDLEENGVERSFSSSGDLGVQLIGGASYPVWGNIRVNFEVRYTYFDEVQLESEDNSVQTITSDYSPLTAQIGLVYPL